MADLPMYWRKAREELEAEKLKEMLRQRKLGTNTLSIPEMHRIAYEEACENCRRAIRVHNEQADLRKRKRGEAL